jgi:Uncharacterised nucleotidyltransferase
MAAAEAFSPELRLALALLSADPGRRSPEGLRRVVGPDFDWPAFVELVTLRHGVGPLAWHRLRDLSGVEVPEPARGALAAHHRANVRLYLLQKQQIILVQRALSAGGVEPVLVKGLSVGDRFYEQGSLRDVGDIDLLVSPSDVGRCDAILRDIGYDRTKPPEPLAGLRRQLYSILAKHFVYVDARTGQCLELHWRLTKSRVLLEPAFWAALDGTTRLVLSGSDGVRVLGPLAEFVQVVVHGAEHAWASLKWLADLSPMIARLDDADCERLLAFGRERGLLTTLLLGVDLARVLLDVGCRQAFRTALARDERVRRLTASSITALQRDMPPWEGRPLRYLRQFHHELRLSTSARYRADAISLFPLYFFFLTRPDRWFGRRTG